MWNGEALWPLMNGRLKAISENDSEIRKEAQVHLVSIPPPLDSMF